MLRGIIENARGLVRAIAGTGRAHAPAPGPSRSPSESPRRGDRRAPELDAEPALTAVLDDGAVGAGPAIGAWKLVYDSVRGTSHARSGSPCQDYCSATARGRLLVAACADGAGSADLSEVGARAAVERFLDRAEAWAGEGAPGREEIESWVGAARERVLEEAEARESAPRRLACTLLAALVGDGWAAFAQIGDGLIAFDADGGYEAAFRPDSGEYVNTTRFLTDEDYRSRLRIKIVEREIADLALLTDGLQMLAMDYAAGRVHDRFFAPLFRAVRDGPDDGSLAASLRAFLDSARVNERTDDDKTLLLAARSIPDVSTKLPDPTP